LDIEGNIFGISQNHRKYNKKKVHLTYSYIYIFYKSKIGNIVLFVGLDNYIKDGDDQLLEWMNLLRIKAYCSYFRNHNYIVDYLEPFEKTFVAFFGD
jgi:hypothetical protein